MLRKKIIEYYKSDAEFDIIETPFLNALKRAVESDDVSLLDTLFGNDAGEYYLNQAELHKLKEKLDRGNENKEPLDIEDVCRDLFSIFMTAGFYYAVSQGSLAVTRYFVERGVKEDLDIDVSSILGKMPLKKRLRGQPIRLAVKSGNLDLVKYLYENTEAMIESSIGQPLKSTPLMIAVSKGDVRMVKYLLENGANPNAKKFASLSKKTPLTIALRAGHSFIVRLLVEHGAIITSATVYDALAHNIDIETIKYLMSKSINRESPHQPYLRAAINSGNVSLLKFILSLPGTVTMEQAAECSTHFNADLIRAAAGSRSVEMMQYLADELHLPVRECMQQEYAADERILNGEDKPKNYAEGYRRSIVGLSDTVFGTVSYSIEMLRYFFEELKLVPSAEVIKEFCTYGGGICEAAYLLSHIEESPEKAAFYKMIALDIHKLPLLELFKIYNTPFVLDGNPLAKHSQVRYYSDFVGKLIAEKSAGMTFLEIMNLVKSNREALIGAVFYYCNPEMDKTPEKLMKLVEMLGDVNIKNAAGTPLITHAHLGGAKKNIVSELLNRNADIDVPDAKGMTMMNWFLAFNHDAIGFDSIKLYARSFTNSLRYALQRSMYYVHPEVREYLKASAGSTCGISVAEIINYVKSSDDAEKIYAVLFNYLNHDNAVELVRLLRDEKFITANKLESVESVLKIFEGVDASVISAEEKASRLRGGLSLAASSQAGTQQKLFAGSKMTNDDVQINNRPTFR